MHDRERVHLAALMYYANNETMQAIGARLGVSRSTVSRLLTQARDDGLVSITVTPMDDGGPFARLLRERFGITAHLVPVRAASSTLQRLDLVSRAAARLLADWVHDEMTLAIAWGTTVSAIATHLPTRPTVGSRVVQLNGAANHRTSGVAYAGQILDRYARAFDADATFFAVPAFFEFADTKRALWREASVRRVLEFQRSADIAVFGIGAFQGQLVSHVYGGGYLTEDDFDRLRAERVVGDVCTVFLRSDGTWADVELNERASGPTPRDLAQIPRRLAVIAGAEKAPAVVAAILASTMTDLVIDDRTARRVAALLS